MARIAFSTCEENDTSNQVAAYPVSWPVSRNKVIFLQLAVFHFLKKS